ncbi:hypothetical protein AVEN_92501-1 [Araneus ventricosus]|uniref:Uncharacterized protein n=1 Tax=Araneus ventricosus TaxID=182803 RepID=A0A4Y2AHM2_ARAVE|nr:hypothetical protein AVEN_92501-1 [Araneus ventricosus]
MLNPIPYKIFAPCLPDILWMFAKCLSSHENNPEVPGVVELKSFIMQLVCESIYTDKSAVKLRDSPLSDAITLYTALKYAAKESLQQSSKIYLVALNQPLCVMSREIVGSMSDDHLFRAVVVARLGGFYMLMSYMGCSIDQTKWQEVDCKTCYVYFIS